VLASVEPQLAIPVVGVVLCALLVYIFGFQKTQEPTFQHLAALTTKSKAPNTRQRSTTPQVKSTLKAKEKSSATANGHAIQEKSSPKANGTLKSPKARDGSNKENVRPQKLVAKEKKELAEDLESGDWIQAVSRKDKKNKLEKTKQESSQAAKSSVPISVTPIIETPIEVLQDVTSKVTTIQTEQVKVEAAAAPAKQDAPVPAKPAKEAKKKAAKAPAPAPPAAAESSPKKEKSAAQEPKVTPAAPEVKAAVAEEPVIKSAPATPVKEAPKAEEPKASSADPRNNIAFDEMGDTWEEAKSRGAKKRTRARKD